jgi:hypothetical protein
MMNELLTTLDAVVVYSYLYPLSPSKQEEKSEMLANKLKI